MTTNNKVVAILQARMSSSRLPGKVLRPILNEPMLARQVERVKKSEKIDALVIATSSNSEDDAIAALCQSLEVSCYRGSLDNVLDRYFHAATRYKANHIVRLTGDCPLSCSGVIDAIISKHLREKNDFTSNCQPYTLPDGLDVEVMTYETLKEVFNAATIKAHKEHVTALIRERTDLKKGNYAYAKDLSKLRWTVDYEEDFIFVHEVFKALYPNNPNFGFLDVLALLKKRPELEKINTMHNHHD